MIVTLSDFILEQEVSTASCDDIVLEQLQAEVEVNSALADAYAKQILMLEYAVDGYVQEADTDTEKKTESESKFKKFWKTIWNAIVSAFKWIGQQFAKLWGKIKGLFTKKTADQLRNVATSDKVDEAVAAIKEDLKSKDLTLEDFETIIATKGIRSWIEKGHTDVYPQLSDLLITLKNSISDTDIDTMSKTLDKMTEIVNNFANKDNSLALGKTLKFGKDMSDRGMGARTVEKNRDLLNLMADFVDWTAGEGRGVMDGLKDKMQKFDHLLDEVSKTLPDTKAEDTTNKQKQLVSVFTDKKDKLLNGCTNIARQIGGIDCVYSASRAAVQAAYKNADARHKAEHKAEMEKRINAYRNEHPEATRIEAAKAVGYGSSES